MGRLWERDGVVSAAAGCVEGARLGAGSALLLVGEAGLGKTSALEQARSVAEKTGVEVGTACGEAIERVLAFGMAREALGSLEGSDALSLAAADGAVVDTAAPLYRSLQWLESRPRRPLLLILDDLHWADADSLRLFAFLMRRLARYPVAVIGALRPWPPEAMETFLGLEAGGYCTVERLEPLSRTAAGALLAERVGGEISEQSEQRAWELCAGNPLLVGQVALALARGESVPADSGSSGAPRFTSNLLLSRFAGLDADGLACARAASVLGTSFPSPVAVEVAGLSGAQADAALDSLCRSGLLRPDGGSVMRFSHPLFAEAMYDDLPAPLRSRLHERAFHILLRRGMESEAAVHAVRADMVGDPESAALLERIGTSALAMGAISVAAESLEAAVRLAGDHAGAEMRIALADAMIKIGRTEEALQALHVLLAEADVVWSQRHAALRMQGRALLLSGAVELSSRALDEAITLAVDNDAPLDAVPPLLDQCLAEFLIRGPGHAVALADRARRLCAGVEGRIAERARVTWGNLAFRTGDPSGLVEMEFVRERLEGERAPQPMGAEEFDFPWNALDQFGYSAMQVEDFDGCERAFRAVAAAAERAGAVSALTSQSSLQFLIRTGRLHETLAMIAGFEELLDLYPSALRYPEMARAEALLWLGRFEESDASYERARAGALGLWMDRRVLAQVHGLRLLWLGDPGAAECFLLVEELGRSAGVETCTDTLWAGHAIDAHLAVGHVDDAERIIDWLERCASRVPIRWPRIAVHVGRACLHARVGEDEAADEHFRAALALHQEVDLPLHRTEALLAYGTYLRRRGRSVDARVPLAEARQIAEATDAAWLAERARRELALAGGRRRRAAADRDQLTAAERRVAELAAEGLANGEIARQLVLSVNTIESHLRRIYAKLSISSRRELMRLDGVFEPPSSVRR